MERSNDQGEIAKRTTSAKAAIESCIDGEWSVGLFISHHLQELSPAYWKKYAGTFKPIPKQVADLLVLKSHWGGDDEFDYFDFTLPGDVTNCVISVAFNDDGKVESVKMES